MIRSQSFGLFRSYYFPFAALVLCSVTAYAQSPQSSPHASAESGVAKLSVKTELVVLPVSVTDASGNFISGLGLQNFTVYDNGRLQEVTSFHEGDSPVTVGLIVDHSRSMGPKLPEVAAAVSA